MLCALALALGACDGVGGSSATLVASVPVADAAAPAGYRIAREDSLEIAVFMVPSLNRTVQVDANGRIELPLLGSVVAGGRTTRDLEADIAQRLGSTYLKNPQVSVTVRDALAQRYAVDGAVLRPGIFVAKGDTTVLQAIAQAGGPNEVGDIDDVTVVRTVDGRREATRYSLRAIRKGEAPDPLIQGRDAVVLGESAGLNTLKFVREMGGTALSVARVVP